MAGTTPLITLFVKNSVPLNVATDNPFTKREESTITLAFANKVSVIVDFPLTYKEESILAFNLSAFRLSLLDKESLSDFSKSVIFFVVAIVPEVGKITLLAAVVVIVKSPMPLVIILLANVIVFPLLFTPVPPFDPGRIELIVMAESAYLAFNAVKE